MHILNQKTFMYITIIVILIIMIIGISLLYQPGQSVFGVFFLIGAAVIGISTLINGIDSAYNVYNNLFKSIYRHKLEISKEIAREILFQLEELGTDGVPYDLFHSFLARTYVDKRLEERYKIYEDLKTKGYITLESDFVKITNFGKRFIKKK